MPLGVRDVLPGWVFGEVYATPEQAFQVRRRRIMDALVAVVCERGYAGASVSAVCARAKVSRRTFYKSFEGLEQCFVAVLDEGAWYAGTLMARAFERERAWVDGVRGALAALLVFFDANPDWAQVMLVEAFAAGSWARECRERHVVALTALIEGHWGEIGDGQAHALVNDGVMASLLGVAQTHVVSGREESLIVLLGPMMGMVCAPYLQRHEVQREIARGEALARELLAARGRQDRAAEGAPGVGETQKRAGDRTGVVETGAVEVPALLADPRAHRARACLLYLVAHPGVSNREVARAVGIERDDYISTVLARLRRAGLLVKDQGAPGARNAWSASLYGLRVARALDAARGSPETPGDGVTKAA